MNETKLSRRMLLSCACQFAAASTLLSACSKSPTTAQCADPSQLTQSEISLRTSVQYTEQSTDTAKICGGCAYFQPEPAPAACGGCQIVNGSVNKQGHCASWSAKA